MAESSIMTLGLILTIACLVAIASRRIGLPYTAGLVAAGIGMGYAPLGIELPLSRELIFSAFLPPLIFEASMQLEWRCFRDQLPLTVLLAFVGVGIAAAIVAVGMNALFGWSWLGAAFFGVLIAATDPVSVIAAFKELNVDRRLSMAVEAESLLNDGVAAVAFGVLVAVSGGASLDASFVAGSLSWTVAGGLGAGAAVAGAVLLLAGRTDDHLVEIALTAIAAWGSFFLAEHIGASGVFASLAAGLIVGNVGWIGSFSDAGRGHVLGFWEFGAFLANSVLFILIGHQAADQVVSGIWPALVGAIVLTLVGRAAAVYPLAVPFLRTKLRLPATHQHVLVWGGLRGAVGLALALAVPANVVERGTIVTLTFGVVAFSIFVQGLTMPLLIKRWRLSASPSSQSKRFESEQTAAAD